jgi:hypothetical protein
LNYVYFIFSEKSGERREKKKSGERRNKNRGERKEKKTKEKRKNNKINDVADLNLFFFIFK